MSVILKETDKNSLFGRLIIGRNVVVCQGKVITIYGGLGLCGCVWACKGCQCPGSTSLQRLTGPLPANTGLQGAAGDHLQVPELEWRGNLSEPEA